MVPWLSQQLLGGEATTIRHLGQQNAWHPLPHMGKKMSTARRHQLKLRAENCDAKPREAA